MSDKKMPAFRIKYRSADKQNFDCGVCWPGKFADSFDIKPETQTVGGQYPKMALAEALQRVANKDGWLTLQAVRAVKGAPKPVGDYSSGDTFADDQIPF